MSNILPTFNEEETNLELHVKICAERYKDLDDRMDRLETKLDKINEKVEGFKSELTGILVKTGGTIVVAILALIGTILTKF